MAATVAACSGLSFTEPLLPTLQPGMYVLISLGDQPEPFVYYQEDYPDTLAYAFTIAFDTVRIVNDTDFTRHFRREVREVRPGRATVVADAEEFSYSGIILDRGAEVKLTTRTGAPGGTALAYFALRDGALARYTEVTRYRCQPLGCELVDDRRVEAWYARR